MRFFLGLCFSLLLPALASAQTALTITLRDGFDTPIVAEVTIRDLVGTLLVTGRTDATGSVVITEALPAEIVVVISGTHQGQTLHHRNGSGVQVFADLTSSLLLRMEDDGAIVADPSMIALEVGGQAAATEAPAPRETTASLPTMALPTPIATMVPTPAAADPDASTFWLAWLLIGGIVALIGAVLWINGRAR